MRNNSLHFIKITFFVFALLIGQSVVSQTKSIKAVPYGDMNSWISRKVKESFIIGGKTRTLYEIGDSTLRFKINEPYKNTTSPWATSSVMAKVKGITKASVSVFPERRGEGKGYAARLETRIEHVKVFGLINIYVLASGTIFLGHMKEPITNTDNPKSKLIAGIPFTGKPRYLQFDYKAVTGGPARKINGLTKGNLVGENDEAVAFIILQKRWEDSRGHIHALRIGTGWKRFNKTTKTWQNAYRMPVHYGNITRDSYFKKYMGLKKGEEAYYTKNSKGEMVPIEEEGWGKKSDKPTHLILQFSSSNGQPFVGNPHNRLWVDNVKLVY